MLSSRLKAWDSLSHPFRVPIQKCTSPGALPWAKLSDPFGVKTKSESNSRRYFNSPRWLPSNTFPLPSMTAGTDPYTFSDICRQRNTGLPPGPVVSR